MKKSISTSLLGTPIRRNGSSTDLQLSVAQRCHHGPSPVLDRQVTLILNQDEALDFSIHLMESCSALWLGDQVEKLKRIDTLLRVVRAGKEVS